MAEFSLDGRSFLIVDDVRVTRIAINKLLNRFGNPENYHAENGHEAITMLQGNAKTVDCIIADFNMPVMHGLQMMKLIRTGHNNIRRDIPVIMVTGHGEKNLLGVALALDVNAFVLKPANKETLMSRVQRVLQMVEQKERWMKPVESYICIDVNTTIKSLLTKPSEGMPDVSGDLTSKAVERVRERRRISDKLAAMPPSPGDKTTDLPLQKEQKDLPQSIAPNSEMVLLNNVPVGAVLAADIIGSNKQKLISKGQALTQSILGRLKDLAELGEPVAIVCIESKPKKK